MQGGWNKMTTEKEFCQRHHIQVIDTNKRFQRHRMVNPQFFKDGNDYNAVYNNAIAYDTEKLLTITIPESELDRIKEFEDQVFNNMKTHGSNHYMMFEMIMEQKQEERRLREKYPSVKKAYEHYSLILKLAESGEL
jgi:hypothetical protein